MADIPTKGSRITAGGDLAMLEAKDEAVIATT